MCNVVFERMVSALIASGALAWKTSDQPRSDCPIIKLIAATTHRKGLTVHAEIDPGVYPPGTKISKKGNDSPLPRTGRFPR
jgi:hypothetical protein